MNKETNAGPAEISEQLSIRFYPGKNYCSHVLITEKCDFSIFYSLVF